MSVRYFQDVLGFYGTRVNFILFYAHKKSTVLPVLDSTKPINTVQIPRTEIQRNRKIRVESGE